VTAPVIDIAPPPPTMRLKIRPKVGWQPIDFRELWHYRELLWILAQRDIKVRYKQTALGVTWAVIQPFATMVVFTILGSLGSLSTDAIPPPLFYFCGLLPWLLFANSLSSAGNSLVGSQHLITKVYFPRLVIPISSIITMLIDFGISFAMLLLLMLWYRHAPGFHVGPQVLLVPVFIVLSFTAALAAGLWLSALNVEYRDVRYAIPLATNLLQFATPVLWTATQVHNRWHSRLVDLLVSLNPMTGVEEGFRWCMVGGPRPGPMLLVSIGSIGLLLVGGLFYFRRMEKSFADLV
jgi:lipopolysaccharide transport system permease protein